MFARMVYKRGSKAYEDYYARNPEKKAIDDELRDMPELCSPEAPTYDPIDAKIPNANFKFLADIRQFAEGEKNENKTPIEAKNISERLKKLVLYYGAKHAGIAKMQEYHYYSHRGRLAEHYGEKVTDLLPFGIAFTVEMKREGVDKAPLLPEIIESSRAYVEAAVLGIQLAYFIRELGYDARVHMDGNYLVIAPLVARDAGIGVIGRHGLLITPKYGTSVRIGVVTTDMPLVPDQKLDIQIEKFCEICGLCASICPGRAIPEGPRQEIDGILKWQVNQEKCYGFWRKVGTDCGICMKSCPFGKSIELTELKEEEYQANPFLLLKKLREK